jgi:phosphate transport system substrate-binding protein
VSRFLCAAISVLLAALVGCSDVAAAPPQLRGASPYPELQLTPANYPRVDGSTSTLPIERIVACKVFDAPYIWHHSEADDTRSVIASDIYEMNSKYRGEKKELCDFINRITNHHGTHEAYVKLIEGKADLILEARAPSDDELKLAAKVRSELEVTPIALDGFVFLVNGRNPVKNLALEQIRDIYSGKIRNWKDVGGLDARIEAYQRSRNSGSQETMKRLVMNGRPMISGPDVLIETLMSMTILRIQDDPNGIAYSFYFYKELMSRHAGALPCAVNGVEPTAETIRKRTYPLVTDVFAVTRKELAVDHPARRLRDWLLTRPGQKVVEDTGYVPLHSTGVER